MEQLAGKQLNLWDWVDFSWKEVSSRRTNAEITGLGFVCFLKIAILFFQPSVPFPADGRGEGDRARGKQL